jgi:hypothetical protein
LYVAHLLLFKRTTTMQMQMLMPMPMQMQMTTMIVVVVIVVWLLCWRQEGELILVE